jgi:hypothetical protein
VLAAQWPASSDPRRHDPRPWPVPGGARSTVRLADPQRPPATASGPGAVIQYWHVEDVQGMFEWLLAMGATKHGGRRTADKAS